MSEINNQDKAEFGPIITAYLKLLHDCEEEAVQDMLTDAYNKRIAEINAVPKHVIDWEEFKKVVPEQIPSWDEFKDKIVRENGKSNAMIEMIENIRKQ